YYAWTPSTSDFTQLAPNDAHAGTVLTTVNANSTTYGFALGNLSNISLTGDTFLRGTVTQRASNAAPSGFNMFDIASFEHATLQEPRLVVDYVSSDVTPPANPTGLTATVVSG
ncbi:MAG: hypothetical protein M3437_15660, partial [Chloroflexota bacterium]|nr:hypothetical protein [Chloroflexota bacterium]